MADGMQQQPLHQFLYQYQMLPLPLVLQAGNEPFSFKLFILFWIKIRYFEFYNRWFFNGTVKKDFDFVDVLNYLIIASAVFLWRIWKCFCFERVEKQIFVVVLSIFFIFLHSFHNCITMFLFGWFYLNQS